VPQYEAKMVRPVAVAKATRMTDFPDVPTLKEIGHNVTYFFYRGIMAAQGIPAETATFYENMFKKLAESSAWKENYLKNIRSAPAGWEARSLRRSSLRTKKNRKTY